jgi:hypothetical protein
VAACERSARYSTRKAEPHVRKARDDKGGGALEKQKPGVVPWLMRDAAGLRRPKLKR